MTHTNGSSLVVDSDKVKRYEAGIRRHVHSGRFFVAHCIEFDIAIARMTTQLEKEGYALKRSKSRRYYIQKINKDKS